MIENKTFLVRLTGTVEIPQGSLIKISTYDAASQRVTIIKPDADDIVYSGVVINPNLTAANKVGLGFVDGIHVVEMASGETVVAGDKVGTKANSWHAKEFYRGMFYVIAKIGNYLIVRATTRDMLVPDIFATGSISSTNGGAIHGFSFDGQPMWRIGVHRTDIGTALCIAIDDLDNLYIGAVKGPLWGPDAAYFVNKYDRYGNLVLPFFEAAISITIDSSYNIIIVTGTSASNLWIAKYTPTGGGPTHTWYPADGHPDADSGTVARIKADSNGSIYVGGSAKDGFNVVATMWRLNNLLAQQWWYNTAIAAVFPPEHPVTDVAIDYLGNVVGVGTDGNEYEEEPPNYTVWKLTNAGGLIWRADTGNGSDYHILYAVAIDKDGDIYVGGTRCGGYSIWKFKAGGGLDTSWGTNGKYDTGGDVSALAVDTDKNLYYTYGFKIGALDKTGTQKWESGSTGGGIDGIAIRGLPSYQVY